MPSKTTCAQYKPPFWGQGSAEFAVRARLGQGLCLCAFMGIWGWGGLRMGVGGGRKFGWGVGYISVSAVTADSGFALTASHFGKEPVCTGHMVDGAPQIKITSQIKSRWRALQICFSVGAGLSDRRIAAMQATRCTRQNPVDAIAGKPAPTLDRVRHTTPVGSQAAALLIWGECVFGYFLRSSKSDPP